MISEIQYLCSPWPLLLVLVGTVLGIVVGAVPGLTGAMLITLAMPVTFQFGHPQAPTDAMILLVSMYVGSVSGGLISATLLRVPGTPASIMTALDGYQMARRGRPERALGLGITASFVGGLVSWGFLVVLAKPMSDWSTLLGPFDYFALVMAAFVLVGSVSGKRRSLGLLSALLGVAATLPGTNPATGEIRLTLGYRELDAGLPLLPVLIGLFAVGRIGCDLLAGSKPASMSIVKARGLFTGARDWRRHAPNLARSSVLGTWIGILPGIGANVGSMVAYAVARRFSKHPDRFGHGSAEAIVASEAGNNATVGGALIPLVALGIPGSLIDTILLGALVIHGLQPGPLLFKTNPDVVWVIMLTMLMANCVMFLFMAATVRWLARLVRVPAPLLIPVVLACCFIGAYLLNHRVFDVGVMLLFGGIGMALEKLTVPLTPLVIGFVLAPIAEENLCAGLMQSGGSYWPILTRPVSLILSLLAITVLAAPLARHACAISMGRYRA